MANAAKFIESEFGGLVGATIIKVRPLIPTEVENYGWDSSYGTVPFAIFLDNGKVLVPSSDEEGNDAGFVFVEDYK